MQHGCNAGPCGHGAFRMRTLHVAMTRRDLRRDAVAGIRPLGPRLNGDNGTEGVPPRHMNRLPHQRLVVAEFQLHRTHVREPAQREVRIGIGRTHLHVGCRPCQARRVPYSRASVQDAEPSAADVCLQVVIDPKRQLRTRNTSRAGWKHGVSTWPSRPLFTHIPRRRPWVAKSSLFARSASTLPGQAP